MRVSAVVAPAGASADLGRPRLRRPRHLDDDETYVGRSESTRTTSHDTILWGTAALICGLGDYVTTIFGVRTTGVQEGDPLVRRLSGGDPGPGSFTMLKLVSVVLSSATYWAPKPAVTRLAVPLSLTVLGAVVTAQNARIIHRCT